MVTGKPLQTKMFLFKRNIPSSGFPAMGILSEREKNSHARLSVSNCASQAVRQLPPLITMHWIAQCAVEGDL